MDKVNLTWDKYQSYIDDISEKINFEDFDLIVGITRGGLIPAVSLSNQSKKKMLTLNCSFRDNEDTENYKKDLEQIKKYNNILIVDDLYDTGKTLEKIKKDLSDRNIKIYTIYTTEKTEVDYYNIYKNFPEWIIFPWEKR